MLGKDFVARLDEDGSLDDVARLFVEADNIRLNLGAEGARGEAAKMLIERLVPTTIDVGLWRDVARGKNVHLPVTHQYGCNNQRIQPSDAKVKNSPRGNTYGRVHSKGQQAPADFIKRQGQAMYKAVAEIVRLEEDLKLARQRRDNIQAGLKLYALTCLLTEMKAVAPVFAMGLSGRCFARSTPIGHDGGEETTHDIGRRGKFDVARIGGVAIGKRADARHAARRHFVRDMR